MDKTEICTSLIKIANKLDRDGETELADELTVLASSIVDKNIKEAINFRKMFKNIGRGLTNVANNPMFQAWAAQQLLKGKTPPGKTPQVSPQQSLQQAALQSIKPTISPQPTTAPLPVAAPRSGNIPAEFLVQPGAPSVSSPPSLGIKPAMPNLNLAKPSVNPAQTSK